MDTGGPARFRAGGIPDFTTGGVRSFFACRIRKNRRLLPRRGAKMLVVGDRGAWGTSAGMLCGCGKKTVVGGADYDFEVTMAPGYPVESQEVITWWIPVNKDITSKYGNLSESPFAKMIEEKTGVKIKFIHPPQGDEATQFNIMIS